MKFKLISFTVNVDSLSPKESNLALLPGIYNAKSGSKEKIQLLTQVLRSIGEPVAAVLISMRLKKGTFKPLGKTCIETLLGPTLTYRGKKLYFSEFNAATLNLDRNSASGLGISLGLSVNKLITKSGRKISAGQEENLTGLLREKDSEGRERKIDPLYKNSRIIFFNNSDGLDIGISDNNLEDQSRNLNIVDPDQIDEVHLGAPYVIGINIRPKSGWNPEEKEDWHSYPITPDETYYPGTRVVCEGKRFSLYGKMVGINNFNNTGKSIVFWDPKVEISPDGKIEEVTMQYKAEFTKEEIPAKTGLFVWTPDIEPLGDS
ncbi:MAG: hypothetical protein HQ564_09820 [Candidatus Saganbacteria bacterium]|nr:hypothetical protein [Candidatus Saganbacteria bacterium]